MSKTVLFILILLMALPVISAIEEGNLDINETYKKEVINGRSYYVYDDIKGDEVGIKAIYEGALGILPQYIVETDTFKWNVLGNALAFGKVIVKSLISLTIDILKIIGKAMYDGIL